MSADSTKGAAIDGNDRAGHIDVTGRVHHRTPERRGVSVAWTATGAVIAGCRTLDLARGWNGDHHDAASIFVPSRL
jgi:hypothetical protein